jgi:tetratricopeptide (TPR) repeat protein
MCYGAAMPLPLMLAAAGAAAFAANRFFATEKQRQDQFPSVPLDWWTPKDRLFDVQRRLYVGVNAWEKARDLCAAYVDAHDGEVLGHLYLSSAHMQLGAWTKALEEAKRVLELAPDSPIAHYNLAACHASLRDYAAAKKHYQTFLFIEPKSSLRDAVETWLTQLENVRKAAPKKAAPKRKKKTT